VKPELHVMVDPEHVEFSGHDVQGDLPVEILYVPAVHKGGVYTLLQVIIPFIFSAD
jgi:hypothetical protein